MTDAVATFGGGCFWCTEAVFKELHGVSRVMSGYAGGATKDPSYREVCGGRTGHAEVVQITYDPEKVSYADLLRVHFTTHDPTTRNRQGNDVGTQYRSIILTGDATEAATAREVMQEITAAGIWSTALTTEVVPLEMFYPAEPEHHDYFARNPHAGYCQVIIAPKVAKFRKAYRDRLKAAA